MILKGVLQFGKLRLGLPQDPELSASFHTAKKSPPVEPIGKVFKTCDTVSRSATVRASLAERQL